MAFIANLPAEAQKRVLASIREIAARGLRCDNEEWCEELFGTGFIRVKCGAPSLLGFSPAQNVVVFVHAFSGDFAPDELQFAEHVRDEYLGRRK